MDKPVVSMGMDKEKHTGMSMRNVGLEEVGMSQKWVVEDMADLEVEDIADFEVEDMADLVVEDMADLEVDKHKGMEVKHHIYPLPINPNLKLLYLLTKMNQSKH